jgi:hypothetical protein
VTPARQLAGDQSGSAAEIDDRGRADLRRELRIETRLRVVGIRVDRVVDRDEPGIGELRDRRRGGTSALLPNGNVRPTREHHEQPLVLPQLGQA